jgi:hypothetical protein
MMSRIQQLLNNRLSDGGDFVSLTRQPQFNLQKDLLILIFVRD